MNIRRISALLLASVMLVSALAACSAPDTDDTPETSVSADTTAADTTTVEETTADPLADNLPNDVNYDNYTFRIGSSEKEAQWYEYLVRSEQTGETLNDAIYNANMAVSERFGVNFAKTPITGTNFQCVNAIIANAQAGDDVYDIVTMHDAQSSNAMLQGVLRNVHDLKHIDLEKPWWPVHTTTALTVNGRMYGIANSISYYGLYTSRAIFFNKGMMRDMGIQFPYDDVRAGTWYFDDLMNMTKDIYSDLDNNGVRSAGDRYGFAITGKTYCWLESFGVDIYARDDSGKIYNCFLSERNIGVVENLNKWVFGGTPGVWYKSSHSQVRDDGCGGMFARGNVLMTCQSLGVMTESCMESDVEFGIVPMPKMEESQESYYAGSGDNPVVIPITNKNMDRTGMLVEAMSAEGYRHVQPAYTETVMKARYASDKDSVEMLDIIFNNRLLAGGYLYASTTCRIQLIQDIVFAAASSNANIVSTYESMINTDQQRIDALNKFFFEEK